MKKYTSSEFVTTKYGIYKAAQDIITSLPATIIGNGSNVSPWTIKGNMTVSAACGDKTANLCPMIFSHTGVVDDVGAIGSYDTRLWSKKIPVSASQSYYVVIDGTASNDEELSFNRIIEYDANGVFISRINVINLTSTSFTTSANCRYVVLDIRTRTLTVNISASDIHTLMLNTGSTALPYEPFGYKIPILCGETTNTIYISEPLRKALDGSGLYDTIESSGVLTRRVDSSGDALATPTTEQIAVPTISTTAGAQAFNIDTTLKPSEVDLTYTGWHMYDDKKYSGSEWS